MDSSKSNYRLAYRILLFFLAVLLVIVDQLTKLWALQILKRGDVDLIPGILRLHYLENTGAAFSTMEGQSSFFLLVIPIAVLVILAFALATPLRRRYALLQTSFLLLLAGAIGNYIDRINNRFVVDFIYFELINFPVFNVADIYVTISVILLIFCILFVYKDQEIDAILPWKVFRKR